MNFSAYALSVFGVVTISAIAEAMLSDGALKKTAKTVFSLIISMILLTPVVAVVTGKESFEGLEVAEFSVDETFNGHILDVGKKNYENKAYELLKENDMPVKSVECEVDGESKKVVSFTIIYDENGINGDDEHTYITEIKNIISVAFGIGAEVVTVRGG